MGFPGSGDSPVGTTISTSWCKHRCAEWLDPRRQAPWGRSVRMRAHTQHGHERGWTAGVMEQPPRTRLDGCLPRPTNGYFGISSGAHVETPAPTTPSGPLLVASTVVFETGS